MKSILLLIFSSIFLNKTENLYTQFKYITMQFEFTYFHNLELFSLCSFVLYANEPITKHSGWMLYLKQWLYENA